MKRVALVHDWLDTMRGGEKCLRELCLLFPDADLYTLFHTRGTVAPEIERRRVVTSFLDRLPAIRRWYRCALPWMPLAVESFDLRGYDLVISSSHCVAKGARTPPETPHLAYIHTPMRYAWDARELYLEGRGPLARAAATHLLQRMRAWDVGSAPRVDRFVANSRFVAERIRRGYGREARVVPPPVDTDFFRGAGPPGDPFLVVAALVPHKGVELAVRAFRRLDLPLRIVGRGPLRRRLARLAGPRTTFLGWVSDERLRREYERCRAVVFPSLEDAGIVPLEAHAMGRPVIALGRGGVAETVIPANGPADPLELRPAGDLEGPPGGVFFWERTEEALAEAVRFFERIRQIFGPEALRRNALRYDRGRFRQAMRREIARLAAPPTLDRAGLRS